MRRALILGAVVSQGCTEPTIDDAIHGPGLMQDGVILCDEPSLREDLGPVESTDWGVDWEHQPGMKLTDAGGGLVVADLDGDGWLDVFLPSFGRCMLYMGENGTDLSDQTEDRLPEIDICLAVGASAADVEGDGDLDLFLAVVDQPNRLYLNDGAGFFTDATEGSGLVAEWLPTMGSSWADMDGDGDLDLFVANHGSRQSADSRPPNPGAPNRLYENQGGVFADVSDRLREDDLIGYTFIGGWSDLDLDGDMDLQLVNDFGLQVVPNRVLINDGSGEFSLDESSELTVSGEVMGLGIGDLNGDGIPDFSFSDWSRIHLKVSSDDGWIEESAARGLVERSSSQLVGWGTFFADMDNDADLDLWMGFGYLDVLGGDLQANPELQPDALWLQDENGRFEDFGPAWGVDDETSTRAGLAVDLSGNGSLDLLRRELRTGPAVGYRTRCSESAWVEVSIEGEPPNTFGIGVEVEVTTDGLTQRHWIESGSSSLMSSGPPVAHFGLGDSEEIEELRVIWPTGEVARFTQIAPRQRLRVVQSEL